MTQADKITLISQFHALNQEMRSLEKQCSELKERIKTQVGAGKYGDYLVAIENCERETFSLKEAKQTVSAAVWEKIKGFVNLSQYQTLKVTRL